MIFDYILQVIFFQLAFLLIYEFWLQKETFFNLNRIYLLATPVISFLIPFIRIKSLQETTPAVVFQNISDKTVIWLPEVFIGGEKTAQTNVIASGTDSGLNWWLILYLIGAAIALGIFLYKFYRLEKISRNSRPVYNKYFHIYEIPDSKAAFTYSDRLYIGENLSEKEREQIINHEMVHLHEKHGVDLMIFEFMKIAFWFNPLIYLFQSRLATLHEYIADEDTVKKSGRKQYFEQLLNTAFDTSNISFTNQFFNHSLIKKRIIMLQKNKSGTVSKFKFLIIIPLMLAMLTYVACSEKETEQQVSTLTGESFLMVEVNDLSNRTDEELLEIEEALTTLKNSDAYAGLKIKGQEKILIYSKDQATGEMEIRIERTDGKVSTPKKQVEEPLKIVPYAASDMTPSFPECSDLDREDRKKCTSTEIANFVNKNFDTSLGKKLGLTGINRVVVQFRIDETGTIADIKARAPHPELEKEAERVIGNLPQMEPGIHRGEKVSVMYSLPIVFKVSE
ncbi:M56 family metallopeptidase [Gramella sp. KN1008]|uniref:M56 family metallopeptidase n=1 Tax=Gramella sp. KN1008 TaxID=2529298 RepID=UPI00103EA456|nr:M56 family metallopeptidase [Gramella sp. KN1008]TBW30051.1 blaR1 peptidase M56 [Gramella sp. KN1008]